MADAQRHFEIYLQVSSYIEKEFIYPLPYCSYNPDSAMSVSQILTQHESHIQHPILSALSFLLQVIICHKLGFTLTGIQENTVLFDINGLARFNEFNNTLSLQQQELETRDSKACANIIIKLLNISMPANTSSSSSSSSSNEHAQLNNLFCRIHSCFHSESSNSLTSILSAEHMFEAIYECKNLVPSYHGEQETIGKLDHIYRNINTLISQLRVDETYTPPSTGHNQSRKEEKTSTS